MNLPINEFKRRLAAQRTQFGLWLGLANTASAEICASAGFDWLLVDAEHGPYDNRLVLDHIRALEHYEPAIIVRPVNDDPALLKQYLDFGVQSFLLPMIDTPEQAERAVASLKYPPLGTRGLGTSMARAARWNKIPDYVTHANDQICTIVQAETTIAMDNLKAICDVEGVDAVFIGPSDLSASMGHIGHSDHPDVVSAITKGLKTISRSGKAAGVLSLVPSATQQFIADGAKFVGIGVDTLLMASASASLINGHRGAYDVSRLPKQKY